MKNSDDKELSRKYFEKITSSAERMAALIKDVLHFSRLSKQERSLHEVDLNDILEKVKTDYELLITERNAEINMESYPLFKVFLFSLTSFSRTSLTTQ